MTQLPIELWSRIAEYQPKLILVNRDIYENNTADISNFIVNNYKYKNFLSGGIHTGVTYLTDPILHRYKEILYSDYGLYLFFKENNMNINLLQKVYKNMISNGFKFKQQDLIKLTQFLSYETMKNILENTQNLDKIFYVGILPDEMLGYELLFIEFLRNYDLDDMEITYLIKKLEISHQINILRKIAKKLNNLYIEIDE